MERKRERGESGIKQLFARAGYKRYGTVVILYSFYYGAAGWLVGWLPDAAAWMST